MARRRTLQSRTSFFPLGFSPEYESRSSTQYALKTARCEKSIPALAFCWVWLFLVFPLQVAAEEVILDKVVRFDILEQRADLSLTQFAEQANLTLLFPPDGMGEVIANALVGEFSVADGMQILLAGTGLKPTFSNRLVLSIALESNSNHGETDMIQRQKSKGGFLAAVAALFTAYGAHAENSESTDAAQSERVIEEILVTATKRNTTVQDTPLSVTAFSTRRSLRTGHRELRGFLPPDAGRAADGRQELPEVLDSGYSDHIEYKQHRGTEASCHLLRRGTRFVFCRGDP